MSFRWTLDGTEGIKGGEVVEVQLPPGDHVAVLEGRDQLGYTGVDSMRIHVGSQGGVPSDRGEAITPSLRFSTPARLRARLDLSYELPVAGRASLTVFDVSGRQVRSLLDEQPLREGAYQAAWDLRNEGGEMVAPGVYFLTLRLDQGAVTRKLILVP